MTQIGKVPEIIEVKHQLESMKSQGLIQSWELPYEHLLTRLTAAIIFVEPIPGGTPDQLVEKIRTNKKVLYRINTEKSLSSLAWRIDFE